MAYGFQSVNDAGIVQISEQYIHLHVIQSGSIPSSTSTYTTITFPNDGATAIPVVRGWGASVYRINATTIRVYAPFGGNYLILSTAPISSAESTGYGLEVRDAASNIIYSSSKRIFTIDNFYQTTMYADDLGTPHGLTGLTTPSGKNRYILATYAIKGSSGPGAANLTWPVYFGASQTSAQFFYNESYPFSGSTGDDDRSGFAYRFGFFTGYCSI